MAANAINLLVAKPSLLRYYAEDDTGDALYRTMNQMLGDMAPGPLKAVFSTLTASWGTTGNTNGEAPADATNPVGHPRISVFITPLTSAGGTVPTTACVRFFTASGINTMEILGGALPGTVSTLHTNCIVEIRFNHSLE